MELKEVREGESRLLVPAVQVPEEGEVFYNPAQRLSRDLSILFYLSKGTDVLDVMAATGARAVRLAGYGLKVVANDRSVEAVRLIGKNARLNGVELEVVQEDASRLLHSRFAGAVDLDPFGSPAPWVHCALSSARKYLAVAATDTAALCGTYPRVSRRRYGFSARKLPNYPEIGVRALAGFVIREAAKLEIGARPIFAHAYRHYYRVYFELKRGAGRADSVLKELGDYRDVGPIYMGNLWDEQTVKGMLAQRAEIGELAKKHLALIAGEMHHPQPFFHLHALCRELKIPAPPMSRVLEKTGGVRTHFSPLGFRSSLPEEEVRGIIASLVS